MRFWLQPSFFNTDSSWSSSFLPFLEEISPFSWDSGSHFRFLLRSAGMIWIVDSRWTCNIIPWGDVSVDSSFVNVQIYSFRTNCEDFSWHRSGFCWEPWEGGWAGRVCFWGRCWIRWPCLGYSNLSFDLVHFEITKVVAVVLLLFPWTILRFRFSCWLLFRSFFFSCLGHSCWLFLFFWQTAEGRHFADWVTKFPFFLQLSGKVVDFHASA